MSAVPEKLPSISDNFGWVSPEDSHFTPRKVDDELCYRLVKSLLERDHEFSAFMRHAGQTLYFKVELGMTNVFVQAYTREAVSPQAPRSLSRQAMPATGVAFSVTRTLVFNQLDSEELLNLHTAFPSKYFQRRLHLREIQFLEEETKRLKQDRRKKVEQPVQPVLIPA